MARTVYDFGYIRKDINQETYDIVTTDSIDELFEGVSKIYCFADCDNTYQVCVIYAWGKEVKYIGWQPDMHFEYRFVENNELAWEGWFEQWEH